MRVKFRINQMFFDTQEVLKALGKAKSNVLAEYGSRVMTTARQSMINAKSTRPRSAPSEPGTPPKARLGYIKRGRYGITFRYDFESESVVVGPTAFNPGLNVIELHEHGGVRRVGRGGRIRARYPKRPYMAPANEKRLPELAGLWKNSIVR